MYLSRNQEKGLYAAIGAGIVLLFLIVTVLYYQFFKLPNMEKELRSELIGEVEKLKQSEINVVVLKENVEVGWKLEDKHLDYKKIPASLLPANVIKEKKEIIGKVIRLDLPLGTPLIPELAIDYSKVVPPDLRKLDFNYIKLVQGLTGTTDEYVDVRIKFPNAKDYVVMSRKRVIGIAGQIVFFNVDEKEIIYMNNAVVEAKMKNGEIYTTLYVDPKNQAPASITYQLNPEINNMINSNPNIVEEAAKELLEKNYAEMLAIPPEKTDQSQIQQTQSAPTPQIQGQQENTNGN